MVQIQRKRKWRRGSETHGHGHSKKWRGAGNRGGRGRAGMGKKAKHKKVSLLKERALMKGGFFPRTKKIMRSINLYEIEQQLPQFLESGVAEKKSGTLTINLEKAGYSRVLGKGTLSEKATITAPHFSKRAEEKLREKNCELVATKEANEE